MEPQTVAEIIALIHAHQAKNLEASAKWRARGDNRKGALYEIRAMEDDNVMSLLKRLEVRVAGL